MADATRPPGTTAAATKREKEPDIATRIAAARQQRLAGRIPGLATPSSSLYAHASTASSSFFPSSSASSSSSSSSCSSSSSTTMSSVSSTVSAIRATRRAVAAQSSSSSSATTTHATKTDSWIYTLELEHGCFYVGETRRPPSEREHEHVDTRGARGAAWTRCHKVVRRCTAVKKEDDGHEDRVTVAQMVDVWKKQYDMDPKHVGDAIEKVRGGAFVRCDLPMHQKQTLRDMIASHTRRCLRCLGSGHMVATCTSVAESCAVKPLDSTIAPSGPRPIAAHVASVGTDTDREDKRGDGCGGSGSDSGGGGGSGGGGRQRGVIGTRYVSGTTTTTTTTTVVTTVTRGGGGGGGRGYAGRGRARGGGGAGGEIGVRKPPPPRGTACFRCGRTSHWADACFATTDVQGHPL